MNKGLTVTGVLYVLYSLLMFPSIPQHLALMEEFSVKSSPMIFIFPSAILTFGITQIILSLSRSVSDKVKDTVLIVAVILPIIFFVYAFFLPLINLRQAF